MSLEEALGRHVAAGTLQQTHMKTGTVFMARTDLGRHRGSLFRLHVGLVLYRDGARRVRTEVWGGGTLVQQPPLEANWPAVKALRELAAGDDGDDVLVRLLNAAL